MNIDWKRQFTLIPVWIIVADLLLNMAETVKFALSPVTSPRASDGLQITPEFAFDWIQVIINGGMVLIVLSAIFAMLKMKRLSDEGMRLAPTLTRACSVLAVLAFAMPAVWLWGWALFDFIAHGRLTIALNQPRSLVVAACQPYLVFQAALLWRGQHRLYHRKYVSNIPALSSPMDNQ
ncbi:hypothetical protein [Kingella negevensis]|uniref:hypothetical protein n=1 Tax=Kingella negevensis TaxID=1522312 RepID=UPI000A8E5601|nr:hypothetical protein [Kingella negevensis]MDK4689128.1 hypothetical protein [Kingella negevensis]WII90710.1 hypothetical protein QEO93_09870 [Kingella negevensis]